MYLSILIVSILILFSIVSMVEDKDNWSKIIDKRIQQKSKITGFAVSEQNQTNQTLPQNQELYSKSSYGIFYLIIITLSALITIIAITFVLPKIKKYT